MICPDYLISGLQQVYCRIQQERMAGLPLLNSALEVEAVGFRPWNGRCLGILITPWFMNLFLLPSEGDEWGEMQPGTKQLHQFPSGPYEFVVGDEEGIGRYQVCSLFSPMFEFQDQETAVATAEHVMLGLMNEENRDSVTTREKEIKQAWQGSEEDTEDVTISVNETEDAPLTLTERMEKPISRRSLLRGAFMGDGDQ